MSEFYNLVDKVNSGNKYKSQFKTFIDKGLQSSINRSTATVQKHIDAYNRARYEGDSVTQKKEFKALLKITNERFRILEKYSKDKYYEGVTSYAYAKIQKDLYTIYGGDVNRIRMPKTLGEELKLASLMDDFLHKQTSSIVGIKDVYIKRAETFNSRYGTELSWQQFTNLVESPVFQKLMSTKQVTSDVIAITTSFLKRGDIIGYKEDDSPEDKKKATLDYIDKLRTSNVKLDYVLRTDKRGNTVPDDIKNNQIAKLLKEGTFDEFIKTL